MWGKVTSASWISTGCLRVNHEIGDKKYSATLTMNEAGIYATLEVVSEYYCLIYVRTFAGALKSGAITFVLTRTE